MEDRYLTLKEVSDRLQCSLWWLRDQLKRGKIPGCKIARTWRIREKDLAKYLNGLQRIQDLKTESRIRV